MSFLHNALAEFKTKVSAAWTFADPEAYAKEKLEEFHTAIADEFAKLEARVAALEPKQEAKPAAEPAAQTPPPPAA
jgi:hypothetical protein